MRNRDVRGRQPAAAQLAGPAPAARPAAGCPPTRPSSRTARTTAAASGTSCLRAQNGHANAADIAAFLAACPPPKTNCPNAPRPKHSSKELQMYGDLVYASPGLSAADIPKYFKDATFGVKQNERRAHLLAARPRRRDDRPRRQLRRAAHLRQDARRHDVRARLRGRRGPPLHDGRAPPRGPRAAVRVRRRRGRQPRAGPHAVGARAVHRGGPPAPVRPRRRGVRRRRRRAPGRRDELRGRDQRATSPRRA